MTLRHGACCALLVAACSGDDDARTSNAGPGSGGGGGAGGSGGAGGGGMEIVWEPCPLELGGAVNDAECATVELPVRWDVPDGATIPIFVQRYLARTQPGRTQLWMLSGGPGGAGNGYAPLVRAFSEADPTLDFYIPDHRGTGRSARLGCVDQEAAQSEEGVNITDAEWPACLAAVQAEWGDDLQGFSSEGAARDVGALIQLTREANKTVGLFGASYGTTWGHRFLQMFPDGADAVVLDSTNWPDRTYEDYDLLFDTTAHNLFDVCGSDAFCSSKLGTDPWAALVALYAALDTGHCAELTALGLDRPLVAAMLGWLTAYASLRPAALATVYRLERCDPADQTAVVSAFNTLFGPGGLLSFDDPLWSTVLSLHVLNSEVNTEPVGAQAVSFANACNVCLGAGALPFDATWPRYAFDPAFESWANTDTPILMLNGELDPFAPWFRLEQSGAPAHFNASAQRILEMPLAPHGCVFDSPTTSGSACGLTLMLDFLADPTGELVQSCLADLAPIDFQGDGVAVLFGTSDAWENP